jgi:hypothetical protein
MVAKKQTKKDLEDKIAELEAKLNSLSTQLSTKPAEAKPAEVKPAETAKPKPTLPKGSETAKPAEVKPANTAKPKPTLPKGMEEKPVEAPKPAETTTEPPATVQAALERAYMNAPMTDLHHYRAKTTGYTPAPNRYFVRKTAPVGKVPTSNWNDQKKSVTGYTAASNQYFATRARLAYHPADKTFGSFSGINMSVQGITEQTQQAPPAEPPKPKGTLPKGMGETQQAPPQSSGETKSRKEELESYESDYLQRIEQQKADDEQAYQEIIEAEAKAKSQQSRGILPKGFEPAAESAPEPPKPKGTLPKGF